jgi:hypothetical protein
MLYSKLFSKANSIPRSLLLLHHPTPLDIIQQCLRAGPLQPGLHTSRPNIILNLLKFKCFYVKVSVDFIFHIRSNIKLNLLKSSIIIHVCNY